MVTFGSESVARKGVFVGKLAHGSQELAVVACCLNNVDVVDACFLCPRVVLLMPTRLRSKIMFLMSFLQSCQCFRKTQGVPGMASMKAFTATVSRLMGS